MEIMSFFLFSYLDILFFLSKLVKLVNYGNTKGDIHLTNHSQNTMLL